ncbi:transmembrane protein 92 [Arvicola amphibius]|uniref:transmembrane protein 92 n=1 Tax=Arvicola amphibius TaxID=1047088 RepID=UPI001C0943BB|nr:transmembrane protein 92 [Arvicola amphibius]
MPDAWVPGFIFTLLFGLLSTNLQCVSANEGPVDEWASLGNSLEISLPGTWGAKGEELGLLSGVFWSQASTKGGFLGQSPTVCGRGNQLGARSPFDLTLYGIINVSPSLSLLTRSCPKGFRCCDRGCCLEKKILDLSSEPFMVLFIIFMVMLPLLCICGVARHICPACRPQQSLRANHQTPPEPPSNAPLETMIWVTNLDPPPPYNQVVPKSTPTEPPPPYSLEAPVGQVRSTAF